MSSGRGQSDSAPSEIRVTPLEHPAERGLADQGIEPVCKATGLCLKSVALSGLNQTGVGHPGRCPGLSCGAPLGLRQWLSPSLVQLHQQFNMC